MIDKCMNNSYKVMTLKSTVEDILEKDNKAMFYGNPLDYTTEDIDEVIDYFENTEEYEKCGELLEERYAKEHADFDIFIHKLAEENGITNY
jgi:hypothetical protein|tara:strand:- start:421 stop:693 length:273 start_codon:yes stop_codon:yes gene_type:complete